MKTLTTIMLAAGLALAGCGKKDKAEAPPAGSNAPAVGSDPGSAAGSGSAVPVAETGSGSGSGSAAPAAADVEIPTEVDFEAIAAEEITDKTVDAKVKALETDLAPQ